MNTLRIASYVLTLVLGAALMSLGAALSIHSDDLARIKRLEADVRSATQKYIEQGEGFQDQLDAAKSANGIELYEAQSALATCMKDKK